MKIMEYVKADTVIHRLNPISKLIYALVVLVIVFIANALQDSIMLILWLILSLILWKIGKVSLRYYLGLAKLLLGVIIFVIVVQGFMYRGTTPLFVIGHWQIPGGADLGVFTLEGLLFGIMIAIRVLAAVAAYPVLTLTTSYLKLMESLSRAKVPVRYAFILVAGIRSVPLIQETWSTVIDAQKIRGYDIDKMNPFKKAFSYIPILTPMVLLLLRKANDMQIAIEARAFGSPVKRTLMTDVGFHLRDFVFLIIVFFLAGLTIYVKLFMPNMLWDLTMYYLKYMWNLFYSFISKYLPI